MSSIPLRTIWKYRKGTLPNLIIIGAQKCATSSLHYYLGLHPEISMSREKELNFFIRERNWHKGIEWYKSNFTGKGRILGEASPSYTTFPFLSGVPERMYSVVPDAKLIYMVRDPIDRAISHYIHNYASRLEERSIEEAFVDLDNNPYIFLGKYYMQIEQYVDYFPKSNILIVTQEDLYSERGLTLQKVFGYLNVDQTFYSPKFTSTEHRSVEKRRRNRIGLFLKWLSKTSIATIFSTHVRMNIGRVLYIPFSTKIETPVLNSALKAQLIAYFKDDINRLREFTGCDFETWCM